MRPVGTKKSIIEHEAVGIIFRVGSIDIHYSRKVPGRVNTTRGTIIRRTNKVSTGFGLGYWRQSLSCRYCEIVLQSLVPCPQDPARGMTDKVRDATLKLESFRRREKG